MDEEALDTPEQEQEAGPLDGITDHNELYADFFKEMDASTDERKSKAFDESEENPLKDIGNDPNDLYAEAFKSWEIPEETSDDMHFDADTTPEQIEGYVFENWEAIQDTTFRGLPALTREEAPDFISLFQAFSRDNDITTAAEQARNALLSQREGRDISMSLVQAGLREMDHQKGVGNAPAPTEATQEQDS